MSEKKLTVKQQRFVEAYNGNGVQAARIAGYTGSDGTLRVTAHGLLTNPNINAAIQERESKRLKKIIATRERRQEFWTEIMEAEHQDITARLRASELLGKSEKDFTDKVEHSVSKSLEDLIASAHDPNDKTYIEEDEK